MDLESENYCIDILFGEREYEVIMAKLLDLPTVQSFDCNGNNLHFHKDGQNGRKVLRDSFEDAVVKFDQYFLPKKNQPVERHVFRKCKQNENESIDSYVTRLKNLAKTCDFGTMLNDAIRDQVIDMCYSTKLRRRLLREKDLTLEKVQDIARASEAADQHSAQFEEVHINRVQVKRDFNAVRHQRHDYHSKRKISSVIDADVLGT
ncbi:unnamed protein product [Mytilus coruscus]|uniref:Retrotransposon gag domain-containing protein n=1 Tax=Mytilus coruscus TaxID=42192 RepID=A0A6J8BY20_MYTCO|nr:unnamed protein product [Mytilus coruscus]